MYLAVSGPVVKEVAQSALEIMVTVHTISVHLLSKSSLPVLSLIAITIYIANVPKRL